MRPYLAILSARFRMLLQYRAAAIAGIWTQIFFGIVLIMVYEAFFSSARAAQPMQLAQIISYIWLGQALLGMLPWNADAEVRSMVRSGAVAYELCRPIDLYSLWYARAIALRTAPTVLRAVPMVLIAMLILPLIGLGDWRLQPPPTLASGIAFAATLAGALLLGCALTTLTNISLMWTISGDGFVMLMTAAVTFFSGMIIPLPLFPEWLQAALQWSPFAGLVDLPFRVYTGHIAPIDVPLVLLRQLCWTLVLIALGRWLLARGMRAIVVQGG
ncbi:ABC transporter permease [soil metagenome]